MQRPCHAADFSGWPGGTTPWSPLADRLSFQSSKRESSWSTSCGICHFTVRRADPVRRFRQDDLRAQAATHTVRKTHGTPKAGDDAANDREPESTAFRSIARRPIESREHFLELG